MPASAWATSRRSSAARRRPPPSCSPRSAPPSTSRSRRSCPRSATRSPSRRPRWPCSSRTSPSTPPACAARATRARAPATWSPPPPDRSCWPGRVTPQQQLVERVRGDLLTDDRVRGLWLTGSLGSGTDDSFSEVDMFVLVRDHDLPGFLDGWPQLADRYRPLLARRLGPAPVFNHVLEGWLRWDVVVGGPADLANMDRSQVTEVFNHDGLTPSSPSHRGADPDVVREMTEEFLRVLGLLPVVLGRDELVTAASGAGLLRQMLTTLLRYRAEGDRLSGALHLSRVLPPGELAALAALPPVYAERGSVVRLHLACAGMFLPVARELLGEAYPFELEAACWAHLRAHLPVEGAG